jgi:hypothetical protein
MHQGFSSGTSNSETSLTRKVPGPAAAAPALALLAFRTLSDLIEVVAD